MNSRLTAMLALVGLVGVGAGVRVLVYTPQPATRTILELKDAGILEGQRLVVDVDHLDQRVAARMVGPEHLARLLPDRLGRGQRMVAVAHGQGQRVAAGSIRVFGIKGLLTAQRKGPITG
mgnify:CR=1 FL=1